MQRLLIFLIASTLFQSLAAQNRWPEELMIPYRDGKLWGYSDTLGKVVMKPAFDTTGFFNVNQKGRKPLAYARKKGKVGAISSDGKWVIPAKYSALNFSNYYSYGVISSNQNGKYGICAASGKEIIPAEYDQILTREKNYIVKKKGKSGLLDSLGNVVIPIKYDNIGENYFYNGTESIYTFYVVENNKQFLLKPDGMLEEMKKNNWEEEELVALDGVGFSDPSQESAPKVKGFSNIQVIPDCGWYFAAQKDGLYGVLDENGKTVISPAFDSIRCSGYFDAPSFIVYQNGKGGVINIQGQVMLPIAYDRVERKANLVFYTKNNLKGCWMPNTFYPAIRPLYEDLIFLQNIPVKPGWGFGVFRSKKNGKWGYTGENGVEYFKN